MIKAVIFDFDDTLVHTFRRGLEHLQLVTRKIGLHMPPLGKIRTHYGKAWQDFVGHLWPQADPMAMAQGLAQSEMTLQPYPPVHGVHETIDLLSRQYIIGIVTGRDRTTFQHSLLRAGIDFNKFAFAFTQTEVRAPKGSAAYFAPALQELERMGIKKDEVLFVADSVHDYKSAQAAGIPFVGVMTGTTSEAEWSEAGLPPQHLIPSVMHVPSAIRNNGFGH